MALKDIQIPKADVKVGADGSFAVRGLSTSDIEFCVRTYGDDLRSLWNDFVNGDKKPEDVLNDDVFKSIFIQVVAAAPNIVLGVIGLAADADDEDMAVLKKLNTGIQVDALMKIAMLTLNIEGDLGKLLETVTTALGGVNGLLAAVNVEKLTK